MHKNFQNHQFKLIDLIKTNSNLKYIKTPNSKQNENNDYLFRLLKNRVNFLHSKKIDNILKDYCFAVTLDPGTIFLECLALEYPCFNLVNFGNSNWNSMII